MAFDLRKVLRWVRKPRWPGLLDESRMGRAVRGKVMEARGVGMGVRLYRSYLTAEVLHW